jgi:SAM-dependent methyltransferase
MSAVIDPAAERDAFLEIFYAMLKQRPAGRLLEIGARNVTSANRVPVIPDGWKYDGLDIAPDKWVTIVGDAHNLRAVLRKGSVDAIISRATFEHLLMPWKVVLEMNRVLRNGGLVLIASHQTFPLHEMPADYWRFSEGAWHALFNKFTGFRVIETKLCRPVSIVPHVDSPATDGMPGMPAYIHSMVIAEKTGRARVSWDVNPNAILPLEYPIPPK